MSKVDCLRKIISNLTDGEIPDPELEAGSYKFYGQVMMIV